MIVKYCYNYQWKEQNKELIIMAFYKPKDMAKLLNVSERTLQRWDKSGKLPAKRTPTNRRYYTEDQYLAFLGKSPKKRKVVAYARVSTYGQKDDLKDQIAFIQDFLNARGIILDESITDIGSGLNYNRKKWNKLLHEVEHDKIDSIYITYPDRFIRFGFDWFKRFCAEYNTKIVVLNNKRTSPDEELVDDVISIIHVFSCRLYGLRKYKQKIKNDKSLQFKDSEHHDSWKNTEGWIKTQAVYAQLSRCCLQLPALLLEFRLGCMAGYVLLPEIFSATWFKEHFEVECISS